MNDHLTRRKLLETGSLALLPSLVRCRASAATFARPGVLAYASEATACRKAPEGSTGRGRGIYLFAMDPATGTLTQKQQCEDGMNPSWLAFSSLGQISVRSKRSLQFRRPRLRGGDRLRVIDARSGNLARLNTVSSEVLRRAGPSSVPHSSGKYILVANYYGGSFAVLPILSDGRVAGRYRARQTRGFNRMGPYILASAPPGSFAISGHDRPPMPI